MLPRHITGTVSAFSTSRNPLIRIPRLHTTLKHLIQRLQRMSARLRYKEEGPDGADEASSEPDECDFSVEVSVGGVGDVRDDKGDDPVPPPVGCGGEGHSTGTVLEREQFTDYSKPCQY